mmetsp:Transcript_10952/g.20224  ORF Transcript_10952/g.20224 Transcript_10952/m.20224 type:complete len:103 (-) Transcript_10952:145-453(-)
MTTFFISKKNDSFVTVLRKLMLYAVPAPKSFSLSKIYTLPRVYRFPLLDAILLMRKQSCCWVSYIRIVSQEKQRLKALDRFHSDVHSFHLSTDISQSIGFVE